MKEEDYSSQSVYNIQEQLLLQQQIMQSQNINMNNTNVMMMSSDHVYGGGSAGLIFPSEVSPILPWSLPQVQPFLPPPPYGGPASGGLSLFNNRSRLGHQQHQYHNSLYDGGASSDHHNLRLLSEALGPMLQPGLSPFGGELGKMTAQEIMDAKALAASKSHSEAERKRRERINNHLAKLRSLLPSTTKTDKASLLAEVIQHVKELKRQTSIISETTTVPTEADELTVDTSDDEDGKLVIKASICCEDRSDLLPELIKTLKTLRLKTLKAEITTLGGRVKNVLFITGDDSSAYNSDGEQIQMQFSISSIHEALKSVMEKSGGSSGDEGSAAGSVKRQRTNSASNMNISMLENRSGSG